VDRQPPRTTSNEIDLYIRTYYSLLRSTGGVRVRAFEEAHAYADSSLHTGALSPRPDVAAFAYGAARLPACMPEVRRIVAGQSIEQFEAAGLDVEHWAPVPTRGRRRATRWDGGEMLAVFVTSASDIDDLIPIVTAYQIEWNKMHGILARSGLGPRLLDGSLGELDDDALAPMVGETLELDEHDQDMLRHALGHDYAGRVRALAQAPRDLSIRLLAGTLLEYRRATQRWWSGIESAYLALPSPTRSRRDERGRPVYFVSSNTHALCNLVGGYPRRHREPILALVRDHDPEGLAPLVDEARARGDEAELDNLTYYLLRQFIHADSGLEPKRTAEVQAFDAESGIQTVLSPGRIDVNAQIFDLSRIRPDRLDARLYMDGLERISASDAVVINIDYPLGMAAYHHLAQLGQGVGEIRGIYVMGKAATLNAKVGDVMLATVAYDEHSQNTYLFRNCFAAADVQSFTRSTVLDNQKALTVRGSFLQNREMMHVFYSEGYTVLEMEAGPYLSAVYEMVYPKRHPNDQIVHLSNLLPFDFGLLHYASDTPYSRRQTLLSKSLSYFGVDATYACAIAIMRRILANELARL
jgi:hypothetical protein